LFGGRRWLDPNNPHEWQLLQAGFRSLQQRFPRHLHCSEADFRQAITALQEAWSKCLPFEYCKPTAATGLPPAEDPETRTATKRRPLPPADPLLSPSPPAPPALLEAWERVCRPCPLSDGAFKLQAVTAAPLVAAGVDSEAARARPDAPRDCGPGGLLRPAPGGSSSEQGPELAGPASAPSPGPPPAQEAAGRDQEHGCGSPARANGASGWVFWADWVAEGCSGDGGGCWCCGGGGCAGIDGPDGEGGDCGGKGGDGDNGGDEWALGAAPAGEASELLLGDSELAPFWPAEAP